MNWRPYSKKVPFDGILIQKTTKLLYAYFKESQQKDTQKIVDVHQDETALFWQNKNDNLNFHI